MRLARPSRRAVERAVTVAPRATDAASPDVLLARAQDRLATARARLAAAPPDSREADESRRDVESAELAVAMLGRRAEADAAALARHVVRETRMESPR